MDFVGFNSNTNIVKLSDEARKAASKAGCSVSSEPVSVAQTLDLNRYAVSSAPNLEYLDKEHQPK